MEPVGKEKKTPLVVVKKKKGPLVVVKKKKQNKIVRPTKSAGLPRFDSSQKRSRVSSADPQRNELDGFLGEIDDDDDDFPSEAMMAIHVLTTSRRDCALNIPVKGSESVYAVAECQIQEFFRAKVSGASQSLSQDLDQLVKSFQIIMLSTPKDHSSATSIAVYMKFDDYISAAREALTTDPEIIADWFCNTLVKRMVCSKVSMHEVVAQWNAHCKRARLLSLPSADVVLKTLQDRRVLLAIDSQKAFQLFLPHWGYLVLPAFQKASKDTLTFIKQSRYGERSVVSLKKRLSKSPIPVSGLLVPWMVSQGLIRRQEKPSGEFVSLPKT